MSANEPAAPQVLSGHTDVVTSVAWSPNGKTFASGSLDESIRLWDAATWQTAQILRGHNGGVRSVAWSPDGKMLASGSVDDTVRPDVLHSARSRLMSMTEPRYRAAADG